MSKKMLKRSLALSALMAFVITGSAMAKETWEPIVAEGIGLSDSGNAAAKTFVSNVDVVDLTVTSGGNTIYVCGPGKDVETPDMKIKADTITLTKTTGEGAVILNSGDGAYGKIDIDFANSMTLTGNDKTHGISNVSKYGIVDIYGTGDFTLTAAENAIYARADGSQINIEANNVTITSNGEDEANNDAIRGNAVVINKKAQVNIAASNNVTINAIDGKDAVLIKGTEGAVSGSLVDIDAGGDVEITGEIENWQGSTVNIDGQNVTMDADDYNINSIGGTVNVTADQALALTSDGHGVFTCAANVELSAQNIKVDAAGYGVLVTDDGNEVNINADNIEIIGGSASVYSAGSNAEVNVIADKSTKLTGNVIADNNSVINANFNGEGSFLTGAVRTADSATTSFEFNGGTWNVTGDSKLKTLAGTEANIKVGLTKDNEITKVEIGGYADADNKTLVNVGATDKVTDHIATLSGDAQTAAMASIFDKVTVANAKVAGDTVTTDEGLIAGSYTLTRSFNEEGEEVITSTQAANQTNTAIGESAVALKAHWRAHMNDMNKRMGELRMANGETGVWTRMVRGEAEYEGVKAQYNQYQLGYDEKLSVDKRWTVGAAVTFSEGDSSFYKGSTEDDSTAFAIYGSKLNNDGTYVDLIARYARLESDITTATDKSDYSTNGMSVSAEFGKRIQQGKGLWIEPQFELTYGSVDSAEYVLDGKNVQVGDMDSLIGRVGFSIGKDIEKGNVYARASYLYDFDGKTETTFSAGGLTDTIKEDLGGGWWEVGVGANINLSKATYIYADVEKTFGGEVDTNWQWNLGVRYSF